MRVTRTTAPVAAFGAWKETPPSANSPKVCPKFLRPFETTVGGSLNTTVCRPGRASSGVSVWSLWTLLAMSITRRSSRSSGTPLDTSKTSSPTSWAGSLGASAPIGEP